LRSKGEIREVLPEVAEAVGEINQKRTHLRTKTG